ncbi:hypothetical protein LOZ51_000928 [Ophidiomyces ophidiicola]|nr:hypothetical protein LOZ54_006243 [Ophidiomyces ophidiicola]KAI1980000.1 hypothetical protein LOZ55_001657 [Ophidiomyces ophidiicola]KAI2000643.1 hypothetical protein LOZ51_000928 [Ophidiomyces ophidiicola]
MATGTPSKEAIDEFVAITNTSRYEAECFLKAHNLDANQAVNAFFENPTRCQPERDWPITPLLQPEDFTYKNAQKSFHIEHDNSTFTAPPSRPPSRIGTNTSTEAERGDSDCNMTLEEQEDREMQQAVAASLGRDYDSEGQQSGTVSTHENQDQQFGPVPSNDASSWAITRCKPSPTTEVCVNPDPEGRKREDGMPAFLRPAEDAPYLAACLTILHEIPLAREELIARHRIEADYGHHPNWWNGVRALAKTSQPEDSRVLIETQRLMAFLDGTTRAFGSADVLAHRLLISDDVPDGLLADFLAKWQLEASPQHLDNSRDHRIFQSVVVQEYINSRIPLTKIPFSVADLGNDLEGGSTLYDVLDTNLWPDCTDGRGFDEAYMENVAPIFIMRISTCDERKPVGVKIPATWYSDRYLQSNLGFARTLRERRREANVKIKRLDKLIEKYSAGQMLNGETIPFTSLLESTATGAGIAMQKSCCTDALDESIMAEKQALRTEASEKLINDLRAIAEKVEKKLSFLHEEKERVKSELQKFSRHLTVDDGKDGGPIHKYKLRGVCTQRHILYVLKRIPEIESVKETFQDLTPEQEWQWWRISYSVDDAKEAASRRSKHELARSARDGSHYVLDSSKARVKLPDNTEVTGFTITTAREVEVLRAAKEESHTALLVYANEDAICQQQFDLPAPLQAFVDHDNQLFENEICTFNQALELEEKEDDSETVENIVLDQMDMDGVVQSEGDFPLTHPEELVDTVSNRRAPPSSRYCSIPAPIKEENEPQGG